jgi:hypothetical protein
VVDRLGEIKGIDAFSESFEFGEFGEVSLFRIDQAI